MAKKRNTTHRRQKRHRRRTMKGGAFSQNELQQLQNNGFSQSQIDSLQDLNVSFNEVMQKINTIMNEGTNVNPDNMVEQVMIELLNEHIFENPDDQTDAIPHADDDIHNLDMDMDMDMDDSFQSQGSLHLSDLNTSHDSMSGNTTLPDESFGSQMSNISMPSNYSENESFASEMGGKKRRRKNSHKSKKGKKTRKTRKTRKIRKQRGGMCFGNGVGANSYDPNFSIYNTRELELFPYRPK